jgi:hypothetical protein
LPWKPSSRVGASGGTDLEGAVADADEVSPARLRLYASMLDHHSLLGGSSGVIEDETPTLTSSSSSSSSSSEASVLVLVLMLV